MLPSHVVGPSHAVGATHTVGASHAVGATHTVGASHAVGATHGRDSALFVGSMAASHISKVGSAAASYISKIGSMAASHSAASHIVEGRQHGCLLQVGIPAQLLVIGLQRRVQFRIAGLSLPGGLQHLNRHILLTTFP